LVKQALPFELLGGGGSGDDSRRYSDSGNPSLYWDDLGPLG